MYNGLSGLGASSNEMWVSQYQDPFNRNFLFPAAELGKRDPAGAFALLNPAWVKIQNDAIQFVAQFTAPMARQSAQETVDRWRSSDGPLIESFLSAWSAGSNPVTPAAPTAYPTISPDMDLSQPTQLFIQGQAPASAGIPGASAFVAAGPADFPLEPVPVAPSSAFGELGSYLPWIAGGLALAFLARRR